MKNGKARILENRKRAFFLIVGLTKYGVIDRNSDIIKRYHKNKEMFYMVSRSQAG